MNIVKNDNPPLPNQSVPDWVAGFLPHFATPQQPPLRQALRSYAQSLAPDVPVPSYDQVVRQMKRIRITAAREILQERRV